MMMMMLVIVLLLALVSSVGAIKGEIRACPGALGLR
jgi:hypothetical protein